MSQNDNSPKRRVSIPIVIYVVAFCDLFGVSVIIPLLSQHSRQIGASPVVAGFIGSVYGALQLLSSPLIGKWSDSSGRRYVLLWCLLMSAVGYAGLGFATTATMLFMARIPVGIFKHTQAVIRSYLADTTPHDDQATVFGQVNAAGSIGFIVGPLVGGHMAELPCGFYLISMTTAGLFIFNLVLSWQFIPKCQISLKAKQEDNAPPTINGDTTPKPSTTSDGSGFHPLQFIESFRMIDWTNLWDIFLVRFLMGFAVMVYRSNFAMLLDYQYSATPKQVGYIISYSGVVSALSGMLVGRVSSLYGSTSRLLLHACALQLLTTFALAYANNVYTLILCQTPLTLASAVARVASTQTTIDRGYGQNTGALLGIGASIMSFARMLAPALGGMAQQVSICGPALLSSACAGMAVITLSVVSQENRLTPARKQKAA